MYGILPNLTVGSEMKTIEVNSKGMYPTKL